MLLSSLPRACWPLALLLLLTPASASASPLAPSAPPLSPPLAPPPVPSSSSSSPPDPPPSALRASLEEGLSAASDDGRWSLRLGAVVQVRYEGANSPDPVRDSYFVVRAVRPQLRGAIGRPWVRYFIQPELAGASARLLDLEVDARPYEAIGLRAGQFTTPFSRAFVTPVPRLLFPDFSVANDFFRADRDTGAALHGTPFDGLLEYEAGVFNGNGINKGGNDDDRMLVMGRLVVNPLGSVSYDEVPALAARRPTRLALGVNAYSGEVTRTEPRADDASTAPKSVVVGVDTSRTAGVDLALRGGPMSLQAEVYARSAHDHDGKPRQALGGYAQAGVMVVDRKAEVGARVSFIDPNRSASHDQIVVWEALLACYAEGHHLKLQGRYSQARNELAAGAVPAGKVVRAVTLQTQLIF